MNTIEIARVMHMAPDFRGVVSSCDFDSFKKYEVVGFISNTDPHNKAGQHWIGVYKKGDTVEFFDSFGRDINEFAEPFASIMKDFTSGFQLITNKKQYQNSLYDTCGRWTYYFIISRICGVVNFDEFTQDTFANELELSVQWDYINVILKNFKFVV